MTFFHKDFDFGIYVITKLVYALKEVFENEDFMGHNFNVLYHCNMWYN